jgi:hypothetical protein
VSGVARHPEPTRSDQVMNPCRGDAGRPPPSRMQPCTSYGSTVRPPCTWTPHRDPRLERRQLLGGGRVGGTAGPTDLGRDRRRPRRRDGGHVEPRGRAPCWAGDGPGPCQSSTIMVHGGSDLPYRVKVALLNLPAEIRHADANAGRYAAETGWSWGSPGQHVTVELTGDPAHPEARITSGATGVHPRPLRGGRRRSTSSATDRRWHGPRRTDRGAAPCPPPGPRWTSSAS